MKKRTCFEIKKLHLGTLEIGSIKTGKARDWKTPKITEDNNFCVLICKARNKKGWNGSLAKLKSIWISCLIEARRRTFQNANFGEGKGQQEDAGKRGSASACNECEKRKELWLEFLSWGYKRKRKNALGDISDHSEQKLEHIYSSIFSFYIDLTGRSSKTHFRQHHHLLWWASFSFGDFAYLVRDYSLRISSGLLISSLR